eukprot:1153263-Pelagomonas_calceolata.AAC.4
MPSKSYRNDTLLSGHEKVFVMLKVLKGVCKRHKLLSETGWGADRGDNLVNRFSREQALPMAVHQPKQGSTPAFEWQSPCKGNHRNQNWSAWPPKQSSSWGNGHRKRSQGKRQAGRQAKNVRETRASLLQERSGNNTRASKI